MMLRVAHFARGIILMSVQTALLFNLGGNETVAIEAVLCYLLPIRSVTLFAVFQPFQKGMRLT